MINWLTIPQHAALLNLVGFIVGGIGLVVALWQLSAIKSETEATAAAVEHMQFKVASLDVVKECQAALGKISDIRSALKKSEWHEILSSYEALIDAFLRLAHASDVIDCSDSAAMIKMTEDMARICDAVRRKASNPASAAALRGQDQALRNFSDIMTKISFLVEKEVRS